MSIKNYNHILLNQDPIKSRYTNPRSGRSSFLIKDQDRKQHGEYLKSRYFDSIYKANSEILQENISRQGIYLEFRSEENFELPINSLENRRSKNQQNNIRLLNIRKEGKSTFATIYIPQKKIGYFQKKLDQYLEENTRKKEPKNKKLINNIKDIQSGLKTEAFLSEIDDEKVEDEPFWCEVWLSDKQKEVKERFNNVLNEQKIKSIDYSIDFPERSVKLIYANSKSLKKLTVLSDDLAEFRKASAPTSFWINSKNIDQKEWCDDLLSRIKINSDINTSICILDSGINNGHPLLTTILSASDCQAVRPEWNTNDHEGHGTLMAGLCAYGDLKSCFLNKESIIINHKLESVKILPNPQNEKNKQELWGYITSQAVSLAEINQPKINRTFCMAVTSESTKDKGQPTSWSASIDQTISGSSDEGKPKRIFIISNGNVSDYSKEIAYYPHFQISESIHDPAQSWNCISVGAYTNFCSIEDQKYHGFFPLAPKGGLSPFTTTSNSWLPDWPIKPDVLFEGGNVAVQNSQTPFIDTDCPDLSDLSTNYKPTMSLLNHFNQTSAATAHAAWFASQIQAKYPDFWPETIRGLIIHSAEWNETLRQQFNPDQNKKTKNCMLRCCGYGIPNLQNALYSAANKLTLIIQKEIQPYDKFENRIITNEMHLFDLPWPKSVLQSLPVQVKIKMRITLSYYIEPSPGQIGWKNRYRYPSHTLHFFINAPTETGPEFERRINKQARDEFDEPDDNLTLNTSMNHWYFGEKLRNRGSIHSDIWEGTPQELAAVNLIAVVPGNGWWKERAYLGKWDQKTRYSLIVSISTQEESIDIYTPVINQIKTPIPITTNR